MPSAKFEIIRNCQVCGEQFLAKTIDSIYCSTRCSGIAYKRRKAEEQRTKKLDEIVKKISDKKDYIKVTEACALFGIGKNTIYRLIHRNAIHHINLGEKQIRVSKSQLMQMYPLRKMAGEKPNKVAKRYNLEPENCYTIGEVTTKFNIAEKAVYTHIRKFSIPMRQIGKYVYVPKNEIDNLYGGIKS